MLGKLHLADTAEGERCLRDVVALCTLPALWLGADMLRVAESLAAALFTTVGAEVIYVRLEPGEGQPAIDVAQVDRYKTDAGLAAAMAPAVLRWARERDPEELLSLPGCAARPLWVTARPLGFAAKLGVIAAGFAEGQPPRAVQHAILGIAATQAASAVQNAQLLASLQASIAERERAEEALREADRRKDEFIATLSHELRNPLAPLRSALELARLLAAHEETLGTPLRTMQRQVDHLVRLVDDLLDMSRIVHGALQLRREPLDLRGIVRSAAETSEPLVRAGGQHLSVELPPEPLPADGDAVRLGQALGNLLNNASRYSPPGRDIAVRAWREGAHAVIAVRDQGIGIPPEQMPRLFQMFSRGASPGASQVGGLGVGLALAQRLVQMHGGEITAASDGAGRGSEFRISLPLDAAAAPHSEPPSATLPGLEGRRVLLVDDNADAAGSLALLLSFLGAEVRVAADGAAALELFAQRSAPIVLLDIGLPDMDGYEVARRLRAAADGPLCIIALTGWGQHEDRERARQAGIDHHLTKPADIDAIRALIAASLEAAPIAAVAAAEATAAAAPTVA